MPCALRLPAATLLLLLTPLAVAQPAQRSAVLPQAVPSHTRAYDLYTARQASARAPFDATLAPFFHGVASGDPLTDRVILWTRVTPDTDGPVQVEWGIGTGFDAETGEITGLVNQGRVTTDAGRDYTVKVDAKNLAAGATYYYQFRALGATSIIGRTKTAPEGSVDQLRFAFVSCSNYQSGYFDAYAKIAERADLDAVIHLGDYFYEYEEGGYGFYGNEERGHEPDTETVTLDDYRVRYGWYRRDADLIAAHQQHPWITVWDDHESANDAWTGGAENHNEIVAIDTTFDANGMIVSIDTTRADEGDWEVRKADAIQAYFEWMPIRKGPFTDDTEIYRTIGYGDLADLVMVDTRLEGREEQLGLKIDAAEGSVTVDTTQWFAPDRTLLGQEQLRWTVKNLTQSEAQWKILGNQVLVTNLAPNPFLTPEESFTNLDAWDGYPAERFKLLAALAETETDNVVVITGDIHTTWGSDLPIYPFTFPGGPAPLPFPEAAAGLLGYDPATGTGSVAVEFTTPSVTAPNLDELNGFPSDESELALLFTTPQLKAIDLDEHGYAVLDLTPERAQTDWFFVEDVRTEGGGETYFAGLFTASGENRLQPAAAPAPSKAEAPALAPMGEAAARAAQAASEAAPTEALLFSGVYPSPAQGNVVIGYALNRAMDVRVSVFDVLGREVAVVVDRRQEAGDYALGASLGRLAAGTYVVRVEADGAVATRTITLQ